MLPRFPIVVHPALWRVPGPFVLLILMAPLLGISLIFLLVTWIQFRCTSLTITPEGVTFQTGVLSRRLREMRMGDIRAVDVRQGLLQRLVGSGMLRVSSAASADALIAIPGVECWELKALIDNLRRVPMPGAARR
jgi:uncharacterized membrane protein YdbT with pleckstrin-like domain